MPIENVLGVDKTLLQCSILIITLQPLVENSILLGILENVSKQKGRIQIGGRIKEGLVYLSVQDDGIGRSNEKVKEILTDNSSYDWHGYGSRNINNRIILFYGLQYGLTYYSTPGKGTLVEISIPAVNYNPG